MLPYIHVFFCYINILMFLILLRKPLFFYEYQNVYRKILHYFSAFILFHLSDKSDTFAPGKNN